MTVRDGRRHHARAQGAGGARDVLLEHAALDAGLDETLLAQIRLIRFDPDEYRLAVAIVASLDDDGYLRASVDEVVTLAGVSAMLARFESVLARVQALDPPGVAARDLGECLRLQLAQHEGEAALLASRIVRDHLSLLARGRLDSLADALSVDLRMVQDAARLIARLDPSPGRGLGSEPVQPRLPDVAVVRAGERWVARLCNDGLARLRVPAAWTQPTTGMSDEDRSFLVQQAERAAAFIRLLKHRGTTLLRVAELIVERQQAFFDRGPDALCPSRCATSLDAPSAELGGRNGRSPC